MSPNSLKEEGIDIEELNVRSLCGPSPTGGKKWWKVERPNSVIYLFIYL